ncbi:MAG: leucyl aminopeptidase [Marinagarivorans sp.]|nr:leucyl aminopeptidase [Marinagarivorans sp.]
MGVSFNQVHDKYACVRRSPTEKTMEFFCKTADFNQVKNDTAVAFVSLDKQLDAWTQQLDDACQGDIARLVKNGDLKTEAGSYIWLHPSDKKFARLLLVATGNSQAISEKDARKIIEVVAKNLNASATQSAAIHLDGLNVENRNSEWLSHTLSTQLEYANYRYTTTKPSIKSLPSLTKITLSHSDKTEFNNLKKGMESGLALAKGINIARELGNLPGNICTPTYLAEQAQALAEGNKKLTVKILNTADMKKLGMGSLLSVAAGSNEPPKLIVMEYKGKTTKAPNVIVGKGITFDAGGISLKPGPGMDEMKFDMCGAASVLGVMNTLVAQNAPVHVVAIIAAAENMPSGTATKPGDVVTSMSGQTIEILNTDAEGRLVLCDALTYAERFKPKSVVDIATLTGACVIALGNHASGLFSNNQELADKLLAAGTDTHDRAWQMPLWDDYQKGLDTPFADMANVGGREGGSITAACFLARYTKKYPWAHLDIAGTAWQSGANRGASGRPVALLTHYLLNNA